MATRLEKLETANRRWKSASAIALLFFLSLLLLSTRHAERVAAAARARADRIEPDVLHARSVEAQDFVLKDADGHIYARLGLSPQARIKKNGGAYLLPDDALPGQPALQFYNDKGDVIWTAPSAAHFLPIKP